MSPFLFASHPEFFAMGADGQRKAGGWICTSNPGLREHFASNVVAAIERGQRNPSLSPTDGRGYCQCPACRARDDPQSLEPSSGTVSISKRYVDFFDWVGRRVAQSHPESVLSFYCYADYTQPPALRRPLATNLCAMIAPIRYCRLHPVGHPGCTTREQQLTMTDGWAAVASRLGYYNYMYNLADGTLPFFKFSACQKEFPYLAEKGLSYMTIEILSNWHIYGPQICLSLRLAYDPRADATAIMEDYWQKFYGPKAAPHMKAYWMGLDAAQQRFPDPRTQRSIERELTGREFWLAAGHLALARHQQRRPHAVLSFGQMSRLIEIGTNFGRLACGLDTGQPAPPAPTDLPSFEEALARCYGHQ